MESQTNELNTKNWLEATKGMKIRAYIEAYTPTSSMHGMPLPREDLYDAFKEISVPFSEKRTPIVEPQLDAEFQAWDMLSDEALINFEQGLD
jgi:hypothetical protein